MKYLTTSTKDGEITLIVPEGGGDAVARVFKPEFADAIAEAVTAASFVPAHPIECEGAKFYVHVHGPDDMIPVITWKAALEMANRLNAEFVKHRETATENDAVLYAVAEAHPAAPQSNNGEA